MIGCIQVPVGHIRGSLRASARAMLMAGVLAGCSSVPDAINPVEWYKGASDFVTGKERPQAAPPTEAAAEAPKDTAPRKEPAKGLVADRGNAKYADTVRREVTPTKPLARRPSPPAATESQLATQPKDAAPKEAPKAAPGPEARTPDARAPSSAPAIAKSDLPPPAAPVQVAQNRDAGPSAPPASVDNTPPARPDIPEMVPVPGQRVKPVQAHYQKRLAESAATVVRPDVIDTRFGAPAPSHDEPVHLVPPTRKGKGSGGKGMAAPLPDAAPAASFQVASVDFRAASADLTREDRQVIAEVARLHRQSGGVVRIVGHAAAAFGDVDGLDRANAVARELTRRGVPGHKIMVGAAPGSASPGVGAQVYLDVI